MEFRILGPIEVENGPGAVSLEAPKQRALLGVLLLHPNEVVSTERLIDELWGERPPATAGKVVRTYVSQLRRLLGADMIATQAPGYVLRVDDEALDAARFHRLIGESRRLTGSGNHERAAAAYRDALALWRGPPLANVVFESFARNEAEQLEEERLSALMERIDCDLALGRQEELVAELEKLVQQYPMRERLRGQLMLALYRSGRQADALATYRDARRVLVEELGLEPGRELQDLEKAVLTHDHALDAPPRTAPRTGPAAHRPPAVRKLKWRHAAAVIAAIGVTLALVLAFALGGREQASIQLEPNSVGFIDAKSGRVTRSFGVGREPRAVAIGFDSVWVANYRDKTATRIYRATGHPVTVPVGGHPTGIAAAAGRVWVWTLEGLLVPIDPRFNTAGEPIDLPAQAPSGRVLGEIAAGGGFLWVTVPPTTVIRVDPANPRHRLPRIPDPDAGAQGPIAYRDGETWVAGSDKVFPLDARTGIAGSGIPVGAARDLAFGSGDLWVVSGGPVHQEGVVQALRRVDLRSRLVQSTIPVGSDPVAVAAAAGSIWAASKSDGTISRVDPAEEGSIDSIPVGASPTALAADADGVWVAVE